MNRVTSEISRSVHCFNASVTSSQPETESYHGIQACSLQHHAASDYGFLSVSRRLGRELGRVSVTTAVKMSFSMGVCLCGT